MKKDLKTRLATAAAAFVAAAPEDRNIERLARRYGVSHTTLRATLRAIGVLAPKTRRKGKTE